MPFKKVKTKKKASYVIEQIMGAIKSREYEIGDKLPPEREIAEKMDVSRTSIREAFSALQVAGIIETQSGDGTYVREEGGDSWISLREQAISVLREDAEPYAVYEARERVEFAVADMALEGATSEDIKSMELSVERMRKAVSNDNMRGFFEADHDLHLAIAKTIGNSYLEEILTSLVSTMEQPLWRRLNLSYYLEAEENEKNLKDSLKNHKEIVQTFKDRDPKGLKSAIERHYHELEENLFSKNNSDLNWG